MRSEDRPAGILERLNGKFQAPATILSVLPAQSELQSAARTIAVRR